MPDLLAQIKVLSDNLHDVGTVPDVVLEEFVAQSRKRPWLRTLETGCGRTTLLFSHLSEHHTVFAYDKDNSVKQVFGSELLQRERVEFVPGPTQVTVPAYHFEKPYQLILIDGPHGYPFPELEYYYLYRHVEPGGVLVLDDLWIPTIYNMFTVLREDPMWQLDKVVCNTAFFVRTDAPAFDPLGDGWWSQPYNRRRFPLHKSLLIDAKLKLKHLVKRGLFGLGLRKDY